MSDQENPVRVTLEYPPPEPKPQEVVLRMPADHAITLLSAMMGVHARKYAKQVSDILAALRDTVPYAPDRRESGMVILG